MLGLQKCLSVNTSEASQYRIRCEKNDDDSYAEIQVSENKAPPKKKKIFSPSRDTQIFIPQDLFFTIIVARLNFFPFNSNFPFIYALLSLFFHIYPRLLVPLLNIF